MPNKVNIRFPDQLSAHIDAMTTETGLYENTSEYLRDLVRRDYLAQEEQKKQQLIKTLTPLLDAPEDAFSELNMKEILSNSEG